MEPGAQDPSALTFREKKTLFSSICSSDCASPQVGRLNNPFSASASIRHQLEHHYPRYLTASAPGRVRIAPAKLFGDAPAAAGGSSAAAFGRITRQLSHKLILETATQTDSSLSPAASAAAQQLSPGSATASACSSSPPQSPDLVAMLWLPEGDKGPAAATAAGAAAAAPPPPPGDPLRPNPRFGAAALGRSIGRPVRSCGDTAVSGGGAAEAAAAGRNSGVGATDTDPQLRAVAHLLSQYVAQSRERGLPVDPRVAQALRAAQSGAPQGGPEMGGHGEGEGGGPGSHGEGEGAALTPPGLAPADSSERPAGGDEGVAEGDGETPGGRGNTGSASGGGEGADGDDVPAGAGPVWATGRSVREGVRADDGEEPRAGGIPACSGLRIRAADPATRPPDAAFAALQLQARQLQRQLQQRALAMYDMNRTSAAALSRSLCRLHEAAAAAAVPPPTSRDRCCGGVCPGPAGVAGGAIAGGAAVPRCPDGAGELAEQLQLEQRRRAELAAQCARLQRQCNSLLAYIGLLSGPGGASVVAARAAAAGPPPPPPCDWLPVPLRFAEPHRRHHDGDGALACCERVRVRLVVLPDEEGAAAAAAAAAGPLVRAAGAQRDGVAGGDIGEDEGSVEGADVEASAAVATAAAAAEAAALREPPVRVKLRVAVCLSGRAARGAPPGHAAAALPSWQAAAAAAGSPSPCLSLLLSAQAQGRQKGEAAPAAGARASGGGGEGGGLTAAVQQLVAAVEDQATAAAAASAAAGGGGGPVSTVVPPSVVPLSVLEGLRGVLQQLRGGAASSGGGAVAGGGGDDKDDASNMEELAELPPHARPTAPLGTGPERGLCHPVAAAVVTGRVVGRGQHHHHHHHHPPLGKPPRPQGAASSAAEGPAEGLRLAGCGCGPAPSAALRREPQTAEVRAVAEAAVDDAASDAGASSLSRRSRSMPAILSVGGCSDSDEIGGGERHQAAEAAEMEKDTADAAVAARPHGSRCVPTPPCSPRTTCSPTASQDLDGEGDLDLDLAVSHVGSGSGSVAAGGGGGSASASGCCDDGGYFGYGTGWGCYGGAGGCGSEADLDLDLDLDEVAEWDELMAAAAMHGPGALLSAVGFLREQLQLAHMEIVSLNTQLSALSHQREGLRARATQHDAALQLLAIGEGEAVQEVQRLRAQLVSERAARARLSAQCEDLQNMLLSGLPDRPYPPCSSTPLPHPLSASGTSHALPLSLLLPGSPTKSLAVAVSGSKSSLGGGLPPPLQPLPLAAGHHPHTHAHPHPHHNHLHHPHHPHHPGSLQRPPHAFPHPHPQHQHQQLQGSQAHHQLQQLLIQHQLQQHQHQQGQQRSGQLLRHRSAPRQRPSGDWWSACGGEGTALGRLGGQPAVTGA